LETPDAMRVRLHLKRIKVVEVKTDYPELLEIVVRDTRRVIRCPFCGSKVTKVHETRPVEIADLPFGSQRVNLIWMRRRFECGDCGRRHTEDHPEFEGKMTRRLARTIVSDANKMTIKEVARRHGLSWYKVMAMVSSWSQRVAAHRRAKRCRVLLIDEISLRRRHRYATVVLNGDTGEALASFKHRNAAALRVFLASQGHRWCKGIEVVVTDGSSAYQAAIATHLSHAAHVIDRFHAVRWFAWGLIEVRRRIQRIGDYGSRPAFEPSIFRSRFLQLTRRDHLSDAQYVHLIEVISQDPELWHAWHLTQMLYGIYETHDEAEAKLALENFVDKYREFPIPEFKAVLKMLAQWLPEILAFHTCERITNGRLEGVNNKLGVLKRIAYGFKNACNFEARALLLCPAVG
jgi:transposase